MAALEMNQPLASIFIESEGFHKEDLESDNFMIFSNFIEVSC